MSRTQEQKNKEDLLTKFQQLLRRVPTRALLSSPLEEGAIFSVVPLIDADSLAYKAAYKNPHDLSEAKRELALQISEISQRAWRLCVEHNNNISSEILSDADFDEENSQEHCRYFKEIYSPMSEDRIQKSQPVLALSPSKSFRDDLMEGYKSGREKAKESLPMDMISALKVHMQEKYDNCIVPEHLEADDVVMYYHDTMMVDTVPMLYYAESSDPITPLPVVCSGDKDVLNSCPDLKINMNRGKESDELFPFHEYKYKHESMQADDLSHSIIFPYMQMVTGDQVDAIPGIPGSGEAAFIRGTGIGSSHRHIDLMMDHLYRALGRLNFYHPDGILFEPERMTARVSIIRDILALSHFNIRGAALEDSVEEAIDLLVEDYIDVDEMGQQCAVDAYQETYGLHWIEEFMKSYRLVRLIRDDISLSTEVSDKEDLKKICVDPV